MRERNIALVALFAALVVALGWLPKLALASGVPITAQSLGIMLCGTVLGWKRGAAAVLLFLLLAALGLPVLAGGRGGLGLFVSPSAGFLLGWPIAAAIAGAIMERSAPLPAFWAATISAAIGGILFLYIPGTLGMAVILGKTAGEAALLAAPFLPGDALKAILAGLITAGLCRLRPDMVPSRRRSR